MPNKTCFKCHESLDVSAFYKHKQMADGHLGKCKECTKADVIKNRLANVDYYRQFDRNRNSNPKRKAQFIAKQRKKRKQMGPMYNRAHGAVAKAIKGGLITRPDHCQRCLVQVVPQAHHDDHSKMLEVMWLCPICHAQRHKELGRI
jgi:hypothetical protein